jgi:hypothetical protein
MSIRVGCYPYSTEKGCYYQGTGSRTFLTYKAPGSSWKTISSNSFVEGEEHVADAIKFKNQEIKDKYEGYVYLINSVSDHDLTEEDFKKLKVQVFCKYNWNYDSAGEGPYVVDIQDLQILPYITDENGCIILPESGVDTFTPKHKYKYYDGDSVLSASSEDDLFLLDESNDKIDIVNYPPTYYDNAEQIRSLTLKESNYFNGLSQLSETFKSWLRFNIERDEDGTGKIISKKISFKNYAGGQSWAGFKYGANLKSIKRTLDSKNIVTKMIVKNNKNVAATNGFCSISRSPLNEIGENFILNFDYYIQQNILSSEELQNILYNTSLASSQIDMTRLNSLNSLNNAQLEGLLNFIKDSTNDSWNCFGYADRLSALNNELNAYSEKLNKYYLPLNQAISDLTVAEAGLSAAEDEIVTQADLFYDLTQHFITDTGFVSALDSEEIPDTDEEGNPLSDEEKEELRRIQEEERQKEIVALLDNNEASKIAYTWIESRAQKNEWQNKKIKAQQEKDEYEALYKKYELITDIYTACKSKINIALFAMLGQYIKEGTWIDEKYADDNEYYIDAKATMYNSCFP